MYNLLYEMFIRKCNKSKIQSRFGYALFTIKVKIKLFCQKVSLLEKSRIYYLWVFFYIWYLECIWSTKSFWLKEINWKKNLGQIMDKNTFFSLWQEYQPVICHFFFIKVGNYEIIWIEILCEYTCACTLK